MLKGHVFSKQIFENPIFALWIDTLLDGKCGIGPYENKMQITKSGNTLTVASGTVCIRGRFIEEDTSTPVVAGTDNAYCILAIEVNLDKENTESQLNQVSYKIVKGSSSYPTLTQTDIVKNNAGIYQYELARFRTSSSGITDFQDKRTFLDFNSIYTQIQTEYRAILEELEEELANVKDGSAYKLKNDFYIIDTTATSNGDIYVDYPSSLNSENCIVVSIARKVQNSGSVYYSYEKNDLLLMNMISGSNFEKNNNYRIVLMKI